MKNNLRKMISYYRPYRKTFVIDMIFAFLSAAITLILPLIIRYVTSKVIYMEKSEALRTVFLLGILMFAMLVLYCYSNFYISNYGHVMGAKIEYDMRAEIFEHFQKLSFSYYDNQKTGELMSRITTDLFDITELMHHGPENIAISLVKLIGAMLILLFISPILTATAFLLIPIMFAYAYYFNKKMKRAFARNRVKIAEINGQIEDNLAGIRVVKSFANEKIEEEKFRQGNNGFLAAKKNSYKYMGGYHAGLDTFTTLIQIIVILTGTIFITEHIVTISDLVTFLLYIGIFTEPIRTLINFTEQFQNGYTGFERFLEIMHIEPDIKDNENAIELKNVKGDISFENVSFGYIDSLEQVLHNVNLHVSAGSYIALVGSSGAGKTTLCSLIPRFYEVTSGSVKIDGIDIRDIKLKSLRDHIGVVQQDTYLFAGTIFENISYGKPNASREEVIAAAKNANAHEFIIGLSNGYDTDIGQRGLKLSGGQKQRLSIARVFLKNPPILIFDEATSALDNESEKVVQESLEKLATNRTTFVIAHRLSTIRNAEKILVLTENGVEESGTHKELMQKHGVYEKLYSYGN